MLKNLLPSITVILIVYSSAGFCKENGSNNSVGNDTFEFSNDTSNSGENGNNLKYQNAKSYTTIPPDRCPPPPPQSEGCPPPAPPPDGYHPPPPPPEGCPPPPPPPDGCPPPPPP